MHTHRWSSYETAHAASIEQHRAHAVGSQQAMSRSLAGRPIARNAAQGLRQRGRGGPFLRSSGLPFLTDATTMSPSVADGMRFKRPLMPCTAITYLQSYSGNSADALSAHRTNQLRQDRRAAPRSLWTTPHSQCNGSVRPVGSVRESGKRVWYAFVTATVGRCCIVYHAARALRCAQAARGSYRFLAPVLSAQFITAAQGRPSAMRNLLPEVPARPTTHSQSLPHVQSERQSRQTRPK